MSKKRSRSEKEEKEPKREVSAAAAAALDMNVMHPFTSTNSDNEFMLGISQLPRINGTGTETYQVPDLFINNGSILQNNFMLMFYSNNVSILYQSIQININEFENLIYSIIYRLNFYGIDRITPFILSINYIHRSNAAVGLHVDNFPIPSEYNMRSELSSILVDTIIVTPELRESLNTDAKKQKFTNTNIKKALNLRSNYTLLDFYAPGICLSTMYYPGKMDAAENQMSKKTKNSAIDRGLRLLHQPKRKMRQTFYKKIKNLSNFLFGDVKAPLKGVILFDNYNLL